MLACASLLGCRPKPPAAPPTIEITRVPHAGSGGPERIEIIAGRVTGATSGNRVVLYAKSGIWWIQPLSNQPFTKINSDGMWSSETHLGTLYAALLVDRSFKPPEISAALPQGASVIQTATAAGTLPAYSDNPAPKILHFSGYDWLSQTSHSNRGGSPHVVASENAWTDANGFLHLRITGAPKDWSCAEVVLNRNLGYGTYRFIVQDVSHLEPAVDLSIFTWSASSLERDHTEMDIDVSRWGNPESKNGQYQIQPYYLPSNVYRFDVPPGTATYSLNWKPASVTFDTWSGADSKSSTAPHAEHLFSVEMPVADDVSPRINLCPFEYAKVPLRHESEVVIEKFEYLP
jgi:hypothetical protein